MEKDRKRKGEITESGRLREREGGEKDNRLRKTTYGNLIAKTCLSVNPLVLLKSLII